MDHLIRYSPLPVPSTHIIHSKLHPLFAGAAAAVQCSEHTECTHYTGCGVDFRFPPGCGDGSSGSWGVRGEVSL